MKKDYILPAALVLSFGVFAVTAYHFNDQSEYAKPTVSSKQSLSDKYCEAMEFALHDANRLRADYDTDYEAIKKESDSVSDNYRKASTTRYERLVESYAINIDLYEASIAKSISDNSITLEDAMPMIKGEKCEAYKKHLDNENLVEELRDHPLYDSFSVPYTYENYLQDQNFLNYKKSNTTLLINND